ncbi:hypothetical protein [Kitasatospora sp. DSM 101779]|uniref:hypothetical protein n=1 Tax=Kitasatospora sp. DSM 101779 TaxID=2853165 RepID=UPI0021D8B550|nr:hypothetical protein [Kitasatospora sp. DSM 101779]MCU7823299.1 hypothetical protein [Kitasatospora sp. DSM 101779]
MPAQQAPPVQQPVPQAAPPVPGQGGPEYWGPPPSGAAQPAAPAEHAPETQYLPPYPTADPSVGGQPQTPGQATPGQPGYGAQSYGGQQAFGGQQQPYGGQTFGGGFPAEAQPQQAVQQPAYGGQQTFGGQSFPAPPAAPPAAPGYGDQRGRAGSGSNRPSNKIVIGGVIAGCAAAGILVAVLMSGGDDKPSGTGTAPVAKASSGAPATSGTGGMTPEAKDQAKALSDLLGTASASRQAVVGAVAAVGKCDKLPESQAALTGAATQRQGLMTKLGALKVDKLTGGAELASQLQKAWQASATADTEYAAWAGDAAAGCDPAAIKNNPHLKAANEASGTATGAKEKASSLWNAIAGQAGLPNKDKTEL